MAEVAALLEQERVRATKERFYARRPLYPLRVLSKPYLERYEPQAFAQYYGRKGSVVEHVSKLLILLALLSQIKTYVFWSFPNHYVTGHTPVHWLKVRVNPNLG